MVCNTCYRWVKGLCLLRLVVRRKKTKVRKTTYIFVFRISLSHRAFQFTMCNGPTNAHVRNKTLIQMSHIKTLEINPTCFDYQLIIIRELFYPG
jgi:hypothetical protein